MGGMVGYSEVYDQQYGDLCVIRLHLCGWVARGVPRILKFVTVSEILLKILSPLTSLGVYST